MNYSIAEISNIIGAHRTGDRPYNISILLTDSRSLTFPEETLFFAISTTPKVSRSRRLTGCTAQAWFVA